jgi:hypothetical protein
MKDNETLYSFAPWHYLSIIYVKAIYRLYENKYNVENVNDFKKLFNFQNFVTEYNNLGDGYNILRGSIRESLKVCGIKEFEEYEKIDEKTKELWSVMAMQFDDLF